MTTKLIGSWQEKIPPSIPKRPCIIVCGSRTIIDPMPIWKVLDFLDPWQVIEGACPYGGADLAAYRWARRRPEVMLSEFPPTANTAVAYHARNQAMANYGADLCVGFIDKPLSESRGTTSMLTKAQLLGIPNIYFHIEELT